MSLGKINMDKIKKKKEDSIYSVEVNTEHANVEVTRIDESKCDARIDLREIPISQLIDLLNTLDINSNITKIIKSLEE